MQHFQGLRRTPLGPRVFTCVAIYHSISTSRHSCVLRRSLFSLACTALSGTSGDYVGPPGPHMLVIYHSTSTPLLARVTAWSLFLLACATLSRTSADNAGPPGLHLCCNCPLGLHIPPFRRGSCFCWPVQSFQGLRRTTPGPRACTCVVIYQSN